ncbi:MAG: recombinase family protein, partial [Planctomycetaceae bacterium]|nr:recombinase family protein [Planctomycetaceae bacterium]
HVIGYRSCENEPGKLEIDPEGAEIVRRIFDKFEELGSAGAVTRHLSDLGIRLPVYRTRADKLRGGNFFTKQKVIGILRNSIYNRPKSSPKETVVGLPTKQLTAADGEDSRGNVPKGFSAQQCFAAPRFGTSKRITTCFVSSEPHGLKHSLSSARSHRIIII